MRMMSVFKKQKKEECMQVSFTALGNREERTNSLVEYGLMLSLGQEQRRESKVVEKRNQNLHRNE